MFRSLEVWHESVDLIKKIYTLAEELPKSEEYNLKTQLKRAATSVALNIAEGKSRATGKDFAHFLNMASASLSETSAILCLCNELNILTHNEKLDDQINLLNKRINALRLSILKDKK
jgi:four helix bundle protein